MIADGMAVNATSAEARYRDDGWHSRVDGSRVGAAAGRVRALVANAAHADLAQTLVAVMTLLSVLLMWFLLAWAFSRALVGALAGVLEIWRPRQSPREGESSFERWWV